MMADDRSARPVSGEIMTGAGPMAGAVARAPADDVLDADYVVLPRHGQRAEVPPVVAPPAPRVIGAPSMQGMEMLLKTDAPSAAPWSPGGPAFWICGVGLALAAFWVSGGHALVRQLPFAVPDATPSGALTISGVTSRVDTFGTKPVLFVDGEATNDGVSSAALPPLQIHVTGDDGRVTLYTLGTSGRALTGGERFAFSSRLEVPKNGVKTVTVSFAE